MAGVNQGHASIDFLDVGHGKEGTDVKLRTVFDHYVPDIGVRCRHVVLGCSNDHGFLKMLAHYKYDER